MHKKYWLSALLLVQILVVQILSRFPEFVENYYSNGLYVSLSAVSRWLFGWIPFSFGDVLYGIAILSLAYFAWKSRIRRLREGRKRSWKKGLLSALDVFSVFYFLFHLLWAMNYHRVRLPEKMGFATEYDDAALIGFTQRLILKTNELQSEITLNDSAQVNVPYTRRQIFGLNHSAYENLAQHYPYFAPGRPSVKKSLISLPLSYMGFSGYLNPFTNEAQVNDLVPKYSFAATASHEMAHQIGYASESEANFIGFLATVNSNDAYLRYSGYTLALRYCLHSIEIRDEATALRLLKTVNPGVRRNFRESQQFWQSHESFVETGFKLFYDRFLKMNKQDEGLGSYSRFVDLMVNYYKNRPL